METIVLNGYGTNIAPYDAIELGTYDSYGIEQLQIIKGDGWEDLNVIATFNPPNKKPVQVVVDSVTSICDVPKEATANLYGIGSIVFVGLADGVQRISTDVEYIVKKHSNASGTEPAEPTPSVVQQILTEAQNANKTSANAKKLATDAKDIAQSVRDDADEGKFNGKDGAKGDKGDTGTTPQLKIGEDNLWHVSYDNGETWVSLGVKATGEAGKDGEDGKNGLTPHIGENGNWWVGDTDTGVSAKGDKGDTGAKGADGVSPTASVTQTDNGAEFTVTDASGTTTAMIRNGINGEDGAPGANGISPTVTVENIDGGHRVTLTDANGSHAVDVLDGKPGKDAVVDATLTQDGQAADAKVTGKKIGELKEDTTALQKRQNVLVGSETGNPASCNDAYSAPLCGLTVYGKSTQDGTPGPDNPVPIVSAGDGGSVVVKVSDGNGKEQTLILQTPTGLPGIPVTSGGNYTDQNGQQWICDEVDLERGVKVQRVKSRRILSSEVKDTILGVNSCYIIEQNMTRPANNRQIWHIMCTHLERNSWNRVVDNGVQGICATADQSYIGITIQGFKSANEYRDFMDKNEVGIAYELATPIETPITPAEIAAYKALTAYAPDTVVQASDGAGIKLDYQRDVNLVVKNLEDVIASMTTIT